MAHRLLGRLIGLVMALPLVWFWLTGRLTNRLKWQLAGVLALGGLQGFVGWWMVSSGLADRWKSRRNGSPPISFSPL